MANNSKKYVSLTRLSGFLDNIKLTYSQISHKHTISDLTDYQVDTELSSASNNPVANSVIDAEFEAVSNAMNALEYAIDDKADSSHNHDDEYYTETEIDELLSEKSQVQIVTQNISESLPVLTIHKITQEEYDEMLTNGTIDTNALYLTPDEEVDLSVYATIEQLNTKANFEHDHDISDVVNLQSSLDELFENSKHYSDSVANAIKDDLLNGAGEAYDTLKELGVLIDDNTDAIEALETVATNKADKSHVHNISDIADLQDSLDSKVTQIVLDNHINDAIVHITSAERTAWNAIEENMKIYTDNAVAQKTCVQIITWEEND